MNGDDTDIAEEFIPAHPSPPGGDPLPLGPPQAFEFSGTDRLQLAVVNNLDTVFIHVHYRIRRADGLIVVGRRVFRPVVDSAPQYDDIEVGVGHLQNVTVEAIGALSFPGQCYARIHVVRGQGVTAAPTIGGTLAQGWLTGQHFLSWPGGIMGRPDEVNPPVRWKFGATPAAGANISEVVPFAVTWELLAFAATLTTSSSAGNRVPEIRISQTSDLTTWGIRSGHPHALGPSDAMRFGWAVGGTVDAAVASNIRPAWLPQHCWLPPGSYITVATIGLVSNDQWSDVRYLMRERLELEI